MKIEIKEYRSPIGNPTCALNFNTGEVCVFHRTTRMGTTDICALSDGYLDRQGTGDLGYLVPCKECIVWNVKND